MKGSQDAGSIADASDGDSSRSPDRASDNTADVPSVLQDAASKAYSQGGERLDPIATPRAARKHRPQAIREGWVDRIIRASVRLSARATGPVLAAWLVLTVVGFFFAGRLSSAISNTFTPPAGTQSADVQHILDRRFPDITAPYVVLVLHDDATAPAKPGAAAPGANAQNRLLNYRSALAKKLATDARLDQVLTPAQLGVAGQLSPGTTLLAMTFKGAVSQDKDIPALRAEIASVPAPGGIEHELTGMPAISYDIFGHTTQQLERIEAVGLGLSAIVLIYVFGGVFAALLPLLTGIMCIALNNGLLVLIARFFQTTTTNQFITAIVGLAIGIDYPLFLLSRFREELTASQATSDASANDASANDAARAKDRWAEAYIRACHTAGKATGLSGLVVGVSALFLGMLDVSGLRPAAVSIALVVLTALLLCFSFLPALLFACGRLKPLESLMRHRFASRRGSAIWDRANRFVVDHPVLHLVGTLAIVGALALPISQVKFWSPTISMLPKQMESMRGLSQLVGERESGQLSPVYITITAPQRGAAYRPEFLTHLEGLVGQIQHDKRVASVVSMVSFNPAWTPQAYQAFWSNPLLRTDARLGALVDNTHGARTALVRVVPAALPDSQLTRDLISHLHDELAPQAQRSWPGVKVEVGGDQAQLLDTAKVFTRGLPVVGVLNLLAITLILGFAFRSVVLPIKAVLMNLLPLAAAMGVVALVFQFGVGSGFLHLHAPGFVMMMTPAILLTVLFALSMDYEVMILSRIREAYDRTGDNRAAILEGLGQSGKVIVGAGAIMFSVFAAYLFSDINPMREVGLALATAVLVDTTLVRQVLLPSAMMLMGRWNYWAPGRKEPVHLPPDPEAELSLGGVGR